MASSEMSLRSASGFASRILKLATASGECLMKTSIRARMPARFSSGAVSWAFHASANHLSRSCRGSRPMPQSASIASSRAPRSAFGSSSASQSQSPTVCSSSPKAAMMTSSQRWGFSPAHATAAVRASRGAASDCPESPEPVPKRAASSSVKFSSSSAAKVANGSRNASAHSLCRPRFSRKFASRSSSGESMGMSSSSLASSSPASRRIRFNTQPR